MPLPIPRAEGTAEGLAACIEGAGGRAEVGTCARKSVGDAGPPLQETTQSASSTAKPPFMRLQACRIQNSSLDIILRCYLAVSGIPRLAFATRVTCVVKASIQTLVNQAGRPSLRNKSGPAIS